MSGSVFITRPSPSTRRALKRRRTAPAAQGRAGIAAGSSGESVDVDKLLAERFEGMCVCGGGGEGSQQ